jgi:hypothetical protein
LERDVPTLALHGINGETAVNYHLIKEEYTGAYFIGFRPVTSKIAENHSNGNNSRISSSKSYILAIPT